MSLTLEGVSPQVWQGRVNHAFGRGWLPLLLAALVAVGGLTASAMDGWLTSYDEAIATAEQTGRPVLTIFTGSDWCPHCHTLEQQVLKTDTFRAWAEDRVVLLMIDLPREGISKEERQVRSRVCIKYGVRTFPSALLIGPDGRKIALQTGYLGQSPENWVATMNGHLPARVADAGSVFSSLGAAVESAKESKKPVLVVVSRPQDADATTRVASLIKDPEFESLTRDEFVVATIPPADVAAGTDAAVESLLAGTDLPPDGVEIVVTEDGQTPVHVESGSQSPHRIVSGLRRFLAGRQPVRR